MFRRRFHGEGGRHQHDTRMPRMGRPQSDLEPAALGGEQTFPLSKAPIGAPLEVVQIRSTGGVAQRLRPMGLAPGDPVRVVRGAPFWGPIVVEIPGRVIALGRGVARHVLVRIAPSTPAQPATGSDEPTANPATQGR